MSFQFMTIAVDSEGGTTVLNRLVNTRPLRDLRKYAFHFKLRYPETCDDVKEVRSLHLCICLNNHTVSVLG